MKRADELAELREVMGTDPKRDVPNTTEFIRGGEKVAVRMVSPRPLGTRGGLEVLLPNYYAGMFIMAVATWGGVLDEGIYKWNKASVAARQQVVLAILQRKALPLALEHPQFLFEISGCSRSAFDQIARVRIGATISSMGVRDNNHSDVPIIVPPRIYDDPRLFADFKRDMLRMKRGYSRLIKEGRRSWQDARSELPMSAAHRFCLNINYASLSNMCSNRLKFCEQGDTVVIAWKLKQELAKSYALLAEALRPGCDFARRCTYHESYSLSEAFGCLFKGCGRWPDPYEYAEFNEASADVNDVESWLGDLIPAGDAPIEWKRALEQDIDFFTEELETE